MSGWFGGFLGGNARETIMRGVGAVANVDRSANINAEGLLDKIALESLPVEERKNALNQLTGVGKNGFQAVGSKMSVLTSFLKKHKDDIEVIRDVVETLTCVMTCHPKDDNIIQIHNTELFLNDKETFVLICDLLTLHDYYVRYYIARFLKVILDNRFESVQELILSCPMSVPNIVLLLSDNREVVRNEIILVLYNLTKSNQEIQKIVAFEGAFDVLLDIINKEGQSDGGIIVNDCIQTLINLLKSNVSNQNYFRETGCIPRIAPLLQVQNTDMWVLSDNKFNIIMSTLDLILSLVERNNISTPLNQNQISQSGIMNLIIRLGLGKMSSQIIRSKSLYTLGEVIHMNSDNIGDFSSISIKSELTGQSQSALLKLTQVILYSKDLMEKISASHVFKCYLSGNEEAQMGLASTITPITISQPMPNPEAEEELSIGQHLVRALFSWENPPSTIGYAARIDITSFWFASIVLCHALRDSSHTKESMLKACIDTNGTLLFNKVIQALLLTKRMETSTTPASGGSAVDPMIKVGLLKLLAVWLDQSPKVAKELLSNNQYLTFMVETIQQPSTPQTVHVQALFALVFGLYVTNLPDENQADKNNLSSIIHSRIGLSSFKDRLDQLRKTDAFTHAEQGEKEEFTTASDKLTISLYDFDFTLFYKDTYDKIRNIGTVTTTKQKPGTRPTSASSTSHPSSTQPQSHTPSISPPGQQTPPISSPSVPHIDRNTQPSSATTAIDNVKFQSLENENTLLKKNAEEKDQALKQLNEQLQQLQLKLNTQQSSSTSTSTSNDQQQMIDGLNSVIQEKEKENDILQQAISKFEDLIVDKDDVIEQLNSKIDQLQNQKDSSAGMGENSSIDIFEMMRIKQENQEYLTKIDSMERSLSELQQAMQTLRQENHMLLQQRDEAIKKMTSTPSPKPQETTTSPPGGLIIAKLEGELMELKAKYSSLQKDQEEVMEWATKMEVENSSLKAQLGK